MTPNNTTKAKTFKVKDLKPILVIPKHQRYGLKAHIQDIQNSVEEIGFNSAIILKENEDGIYTLENGGQRWRAIKDTPEQEVHCVIAPKDVDTSRLFADTNQLVERLKEYDIIRHNAYLKDIEQGDVKNVYQFVWDYVYQNPLGEDVHDATSYTFSHSAIKKLFFKYYGEKMFENGYAKFKKDKQLRLNTYRYFTDEYLTALKKETGYDNLDSFNHIVSKTALVVLIEHIISCNQDWSFIDIFNDVVKYGKFLDENMDKELNTTKDNVLVYYKKYANNN